MYRVTLFNTPLITPVFYAIARLWLRLSGWQLKGAPPRIRKFLVIAYPHTSNWDVPCTIAVCLLYGLRIYWLGKASLFRGPMGPIMKWLGGIPVDIDRSRNQVQQVIEKFNRAQDLVIVISPEGNRSYVRRWKTGFYHIAVGAGVPIVLGYLDFEKKCGGYLDSFTPSGDIDQDIKSIQSRYAGIKGLYPHQSEWQWD